MPGPGARFSEGQGTQTDKALSPKELPESRGGRSQHASLTSARGSSFSATMEEVKPASPVAGAD